MEEVSMLSIAQNERREQPSSVTSFPRGIPEGTEVDFLLIADNPADMTLFCHVLEQGAIPLSGGGEPWRRVRCFPEGLSLAASCPGDGMEGVRG
jgi:hypothetical protein